MQPGAALAEVIAVVAAVAIVVAAVRLVVALSVGPAAAGSQIVLVAGVVIAGP